MVGPNVRICLCGGGCAEPAAARRTPMSARQPSRIVRGVLLAALTAPFLTGCLAHEHPNFNRYEYLFIEGVFQPPHREFPSGADRGDWLCYDSRVNREFGCTFVHGGWESYHYIYRPRSSRRAGSGA